MGTAVRILEFCAISGCVNPHRSRGLCHAHYMYVSKRIRLTGQPSVLRRPLDEPKRTVDPNIPLPIRFMHHIRVSRECWEWQGALNQGYGVITVGGKKIGAHRVAYELMVGDIPEGMFVCHHCDNKKCVRPDHLFTGTVQDNVDDYIRKFGSFRRAQHS